MAELTIDEKFEKAHTAGKINDEQYEEIGDIHLNADREKAMEEALKKK